MTVRFEEEVDGFDIYYGTTPQYNEGPYPAPPAPFSEENRPPGFANRGRPRERTWIPGVNFHGRGSKWTGGTMRIYADSVSKDVTPVPVESPISVAPSTTSSSKRSKKKKRKSSKSVSRSGSRSSSGSSRRSSSSGSSRSASSSIERKAPLSSTGPKVALELDNEIEPGEREPLGIYITKLPLRSSDTSLRDGLFHEYKKYGKVTAVQVCGVADNRYAIVSFKQGEDAAKALAASQGKRFFGTQIEVAQHEGIEVDDADLKAPEVELDEHHPKATRTLFIGNLEKEITIEELKEKLKTYGEILDVDVKRQGAVSAYAFIQFSDISSVVRALRDLEGTSIGANKVKLGFGKSMATSCIWLDNLADSINEGFLCRQFGRFGVISHAVVDRTKKRGLVFFMNIESAQYALPEMRNRIWNGKKVHIDFASRDCQEAFFQKMEASGQLQPGERPDPRWMNKQMQNDPHWDENVEEFPAGAPPHPGMKRGGFFPFRRGRGRFMRGWGAFRGRGAPFDHSGFGEEFPGRRKQFDEFSQGSGTYPEDDYEQELREYGHSQRERRERSASPLGYEDSYYEASSQPGRDYELYDKHRYEQYRSPSSERELDLSEEYKYKSRTSDERYYYKDKYYEMETKSRERSLSSDSEKRYRVASEIVHSSRSRSPSLKHKRTKELPISYRSQSPPTPTDDEPLYYSNSRDPSPTDFDSAFRKYGDYKKRLSSGLESDKSGKSSALTLGGLRKEIESVKAEDRLSRKRSYEQTSPKKMERQQSRGSRAGSLYDYDRSEKLTPKELLTKVARLKSELYERTTGKSSPSSGSSYGDIDPATLTEADLAKLNRERLKLLDKLTQMDDNGSTSDTESNGDMRRKKARIDQGHSKYFQKSESLNMTKHELKEKLKLLDSTQSYRKQMESSRKKEQEKELLRELKKAKSTGDVKRDLFNYSDTEENLSLNSPKDIPSGFIPKKRRKLESESDRKSRSYRMHHEEEEGAYNSSDEDKADLLQRQISSHSDLFDRTRTVSGGMDLRLENDSLFSSTNIHSQGKDESRRISSGSESNKEHTEHRRRKKQKNNHIIPLIPLGEDDLPDPEVSDPRIPREKRDSALILPLPKFAQYIHFSPLPSPTHNSPESYNDLPKSERTPPGHRESLKLPETRTLPQVATDSEYQSPCFSPQSSSSKTHSPSQSPPSGTGSENSKGNSEENLGSFPSDEITPEPVSDENKLDSLDSVPTLDKGTGKKEDGNLSDSNSEPEISFDDNLSIEERIRQLDEKWSKAQAQAANTPKTISDVDSVVNISTPSNNLPLITSVTTLTNSSPAISSIYSKFKIRKKNDSPAEGGDKTEPSEIVRTVLSKSSIFDQDSKRLEQINDKYEGSDSGVNVDDQSSVVVGGRTKTETNEMPMSTLPGSLMERLGPNTAFPTLTVNTSLADQMSGGSPNNMVNKSLDSSLELHVPDNLTPKTSPRIVNHLNNSANLTPSNPFTEGSITPKSSVSLNDSDLHLPVSEVIQNPFSIEHPARPMLDNKNNFVTTPEFVRQNELISDRLDTTDRDLSEKETSTNWDSNVTCGSHSVENSLENKGVNESVNGRLDGSSGMLTEDNIDYKKTQSAVDEKFERKHEVDKSPAVDPNPFFKPEVFSVCVVKDYKKDKKETEGNNVKDLSSRSAFDVDIFGMSDPIVIGKRKHEDVTSSSDTDSKTDMKSDTELKTESKAEPMIETKTESENKVKQETEDKVKSEKEIETEKSSHKSKSHSEKEKGKSERDRSKDKSKSHSSSEPDSKKQKTSKDKDKKSDSSKKDEKHKKKDGEKKSESHKSSSDKKDKHKSKSDKDKKESDKKSKEEKDKKDHDEKKKPDPEKKDGAKDEKKDKPENEKKEKHDAERKDKHETDKKDKREKEKHENDKKDKHESIEKKDKSEIDKKEKTDEHKKVDKSKSTSSDKDKKDKKESHKHDKHSDKHGLKSPDKKQSKTSSSDKKDKDISKDSEKSKDTEKSDKSSKSEKKSDHAHKKEHKSSSSHKTKKMKEEMSDSSKSKEYKESNESKDNEQSENKKDTAENSSESKLKSAPSVDKAEDLAMDADSNETKEHSEEKHKNKEKSEKTASAEKCKDSKLKDKDRENKDKDPDSSKSKGKPPSASDSSDKSKLSDSKSQKSKSEKTNDEKSSDSKQEDKKNKDSSAKSGSILSNNTSKSGSKESDKEKVKTDSQKKSSSKNDKPSNKSSTKTNSSSKKEEKSSKDNGKENKENSKGTGSKETKDKETPKKKPEHKDHRLTELEKLDVNLADFCLEPYVSMYDKVKRRSTDKKDKEKESEELRKQLNEYKKKRNKKKLSLSDVTESSELSTDEERRKKRENKKKFGLSFVDSDSSSDEDTLQNRKKSTKIQKKKPKRILDVYSSDSEEEEIKSPPKKTSSNSKTKKTDHHFDFDSLSESDNKTASTKPAKSKTSVKSKKNEKTPKTKTPAKKDNKPKILGKNFNLKDLFSDDSDDSHFSDSDSDSDIMLKPKPKKKPDTKLPANKKSLPKGSSIYTTSEDSESEPESKPTLSPVKKSPPEKLFDKKYESDTFTSDPEPIEKEKDKTQSMPLVNKKHSDESDHFFSDPEFARPKNKAKSSAKDAQNVINKDTNILSAPEMDIKHEKTKDKIKKQKSKDKSNKENKKSKKKKNLDILSDSENLSKNMSKLEVAEVFSETVFEKDEPLKHIDQMPVLSSEKDESIVQPMSSSFEKDLNKLGIDNNHKITKPDKIKSKKHKKEKKKKNKEKDREKNSSSGNIPDIMSDGDEHSSISKSDIAADGKQDGGIHSDLNSSRNLFDELRADVSSDDKEMKKKHKKNKDKKEKEHTGSKVDIKQEPPEIQTSQNKSDNSCEITETSHEDLKQDDEIVAERQKETDVSRSQKCKESPARSTGDDIEKPIQGNDPFEFTEEEAEKNLTPFKESHVKIMKPSAFPDLKLREKDDDKDFENTDIPIEIGVEEVEYQTQEQDYKDESEDVCPELETREEVVESVETSTEEKAGPGRPKQKDKKRRGRRNSVKETDADHGSLDSNVFGVSYGKPESKTEFGFNSAPDLDNSQKAVDELQSEVLYEPPTSNEHQLVIDEGVSLQVQDETVSAVESIVEANRNDVDETAKAVESILIGNEIPGFGMSDPSQPTPQQLEEAYLGNLNQPEAVPLQTVEVEATTIQPDKNKMKSPGKKRGRRSKSGQSEISSETEASIMETIESVSHGNDIQQRVHSSYLSDVTSQNQDDDDAEDRLQIDFDPPKPEPKKKTRKPRQTKAEKMADAAAVLAAENKLDLFGSHLHDTSDTDTENKGVSDVNRDSVSENELESSACSKNEDLLFMDREDQRHDTELLSPDDERSNEDMAATDVVKKKRGRKPKNQANSPRGSRTMSPRSPRSNDPRSPKYESPSPQVRPGDLKGKRGKSLLEDGDMKEIINEETGEIKISSIENIKNKLNFTEVAKNAQKFGNIFDFDENEEATVKQQRQRRKKGDGLLSPENRGVFSSPDRNQHPLSDDKLLIGSPEARMRFNSQEQRIGLMSPEKKGIDTLNKLDTELKSSPYGPLGLHNENQKLEILSVTEEKEPEPLFKAFFEAKSKSGNEKILPSLPTRRPSGSQNELKDLKIDTSKQDNDKSKSLMSPPGLMSPPDKSRPLMSPQMKSNVDKTIEDVSKGLFEGSTDDEGGASETGSGQKRRTSKKSREDKKEQPVVSSPQLTPLTPVAVSIGEPPLSTHVAPLTSPTSVPVSQASISAEQGLSEEDKATPKEIVPNGPQPSVSGPLSLEQKSTIKSPTKNMAPEVTMTTATVTSTISSLPHSKVEPGQIIANAVTATTEDVLKNAMPSVLVPGISASSAMNVVQKVSSASGAAPAGSAAALDAQKAAESQKMQELFEKQRLEQQKLIQKQQTQELMLKRQQEVQVRLQEEEHQRLLQKHQELQKLQEKCKQLQEQQKIQEKEKEQQQQEVARQKQLEEQHKQLQQHLEQLQRQGHPGVPPGIKGHPPPPPMLSPGALRAQRPSLPSPGASQGPRPPISAHHQMPPGTPFGLPGQHPGAIPIHPGHLSPGQLPLPMISPGLGQDKLPTSVAQQMLTVQKAQQAQMQQAQMQKVQAQMIAEQQAQIAKAQAQEAQAKMKQQAQQQAHMQGEKQLGSGPQPTTPGKKGQEQGGTKSQGNRKDATPQRPPSGHGPIPPLPTGKDAPRPGSQEAANQLQQHIRQQLALSQAQGHPPGHPPQHPVHSWPMHQGRPEGQPREEPRSMNNEARTSMPGPVPVLGGNPQSVQRVSPHPPNKSPTVAQTAPNMALGFTPHQASAPRAPSPAVAKTAERGPNGKWTSPPGPQRPGQPEVRPRAPHPEPSTRPEIWGIHGPPGQPPQGLNITPRPAHQQPPTTHQPQPDHPLPLQRPPGPEQLGTKDKFMQQQREKHIQELALLHQQEMQRQQQEMQQQRLRDQVLHSQAQKEAQKERERAQEIDREGRVSQSPSDPRQSPAGVLSHRMGYPAFVEPRPPSREGKIIDPRFPQYPPGHHPADLRISSSQAPSAFSPAAPGSTESPHMYTPADIQRLPNGLIPHPYPGGLRMLEPHMVPGPAPYMIPGHPITYIPQHMDQQHLMDGRPQSRGSGRPPSTSSSHNVSPTLAAPPDGRLPPRSQNGPQSRPGSDGPHPGDGSLLSLLQRYPVMWQGILGLKNDNCVVQMHFIAGCRPLVKLSLPQQGPDGTVQPLRIAQRMRLEPAQLDGVAKRMQFEKDYCMMLALPCGRDHTDIYQQTRAMSTGFIQYLQQKQAAGIVNVADPGSQQPAYVVHIFPPCEFSNATLSRLGFDLLYQVKDLAHLIVIIATVA